MTRPTVRLDPPLAAQLLRSADRKHALAEVARDSAEHPGDRKRWEATCEALRLRRSRLRTEARAAYITDRRDHE